jgi:hypothetical protein
MQSPKLTFYTGFFAFLKSLHGQNRALRLLIKRKEGTLMSSQNKLYRVKISKTVYQTVEVLAPDAKKAIEAAQGHCPAKEKTPYFDGFRDESAPKASDATEITHPTGYESAQIEWEEKN